MKVTPDLVLASIQTLHQPAGFTWQELMAEIARQDIVVKDWLTEVRGPLQYAIDKGAIVRSSNTEEERYLRGPNAVPTLGDEAAPAEVPPVVSSVQSAVTRTCSPVSSNAEIAKSLVKNANRVCKDGKAHPGFVAGVYACYCIAYKLSDKRTSAIKALLVAMGYPLEDLDMKPVEFKPRKDSALEFFTTHNGERHAKLEAGRQERIATGATKSDEWNKLWDEEDAFLKANNIKYSPDLGWHFTR